MEKLDMSDFYSRKPVPMWRIILYGLLAAAGVATLGYLQNDHRLYIEAIFLGAIVAGLGFLMSWARASVQPAQTAPEQPARFPKWIYWAFFGGLAVISALRLWDAF